MPVPQKYQLTVPFYDDDPENVTGGARRNRSSENMRAIERWGNIFPSGTDVILPRTTLTALTGQANPSTFTISNIPQTYSGLIYESALTWAGGGLPTIQMQVSGNTGANYATDTIYTNAGGVPTTYTATGATSCRIGLATSLTSMSYQRVEWFYTYTVGSWAALLHYANNSVVGARETGTGQVMGPGPVTSITITASANNFSGTDLVALYGKL